MLALGGKMAWATPYEQSAQYSAITRALFEVNRLLPVVDKIQLLNYPLRPSTYIKGITVHKGGEDTTFNASEISSLAFAVSGYGRAELYRIIDDEETEIKSFTWGADDAPNTDFTIHKVIIDRDLRGTGKYRLVFKGNYNYMIKDVSFYNDLAGENESDVKIYSDLIKYDIASVEYAGSRFMAFSNLPVRCNNVSLNSSHDYKIEGSNVYLPANKYGVYEVEYLVQPASVTADNVDAEIDIDPQLHDLVALKAAYYLYMLTDSEVAASCNNEYQRLLGIVLTKIRKVKTPVKFRDVRGW